MKIAVRHPPLLTTLFAEKANARISVIEADVILGYLDGHAYSVLYDDEHGLWLKDANEPDGYEEPSEPAEIVDFCIEQNAKLIEAAGTNGSDENYIRSLRKDEEILEHAAEKIRGACEPEGDGERHEVFDVRITEKLERVVRIEAHDAAEAEEIAEERWGRSEWVLTSDDFTGAEFHTIPKIAR